MLKRCFDLCLVGLACPVVVPLVATLALAVRATSGAPAFFVQTRVGRGGKPFSLFKLRTMTPHPGGLELTATGDPRVTSLGRFLRRSKLDELPQLWNVARGDMSWVGPRPEVPRYVDQGDRRWREALRWRPGITDAASLALRHEEALLAAAVDREAAYRDVLLAVKLDLAQAYASQQSFAYDAYVLWRTLRAVGPRSHDAAEDTALRAQVAAAIRQHNAVHARSRAS